jgi:flavin reductase (DIM6/NTAB) family NADH-FMN oxidoreductase RutF
MAKHVGVQLPDDLLTLLKTGKVVGVLATFSEKGVPNTMPVQWIYPKGSESILLTIHKEHTSYHNMVWQKKVMFCLIGEGNIAYSVLGRVGVVRAPSMINPLMNVVRADIIEVKSDRSQLVNINAGLQWSYVSPEAEELGEALMEELHDLATVL